MPHYLILSTKNEELIEKLIRTITNVVIDLGNSADLFFLSEAPVGVNLNRYDGIIIGGYSERTLNCREVTTWIEDNLELLIRKQCAFFVMKSEKPITFLFKPFILSVVSNAQEATSFALNFENEVHKDFRCGLSFESEFKREYLENGRKLAFP